MPKAPVNAADASRFALAANQNEISTREVVMAFFLNRVRLPPCNHKLTKTLTAGVDSCWVGAIQKDIADRQCGSAPGAHRQGAETDPAALSSA
jgi:hypothetical protein